MRLYRAAEGIYVEYETHYYMVPAGNWDELLASPDLHQRVLAATRGTQVDKPAAVLAPIVSQEVWAAGVTYYRSRDARMEESKDAGGGDFYDRVYSAERPELFFKSSGYKAVSPGDKLRIRRDAKWSVPEPELTLFINPAGEIAGYTIGNDMSSRDIEGENPLYLPQAKVYDGSCAIGPCILLSQEPLDRGTTITLQIARGGNTVFSGRTTLAELKRDPKELAHYLFRESTFPHGVFLMTGTGIVPGEEFSLESGDRISITIEPIGTLENVVGPVDFKS